MPCPPSFEELAMMRNDQSLNESTPKFDRWRLEILDTYALMKEWKGYKNIQEWPVVIVRGIQVAELFVSEHPPQWDKTAPKSEDYLSDAVVNYYSQMASWYSEQVGQLELALCLLRTWLCEQHRTATFVPPLFESRFQREKSLHMEHRLLDKAAALKQLEYMLAINAGNQKKETDPVKLEELKRLEIKGHQDIEFINGISNEEILVNREILKPYLVNYWPVC